MYFDKEEYNKQNNSTKNSSSGLVLKLSIKNMTKSIKDYAIYFLTLVLGVAIFYMFNSLDSQQAMLEVSRVYKANYKTNDRYVGIRFCICISSIRLINCICE